MQNLYINQALKQLKSNYERPDSSTDKLRDYNGESVEHPVDDDRNSNYPKIFNGKIASSNTVLKNPMKRDMLKKEHCICNRNGNIWNCIYSLIEWMST